MNITILCVGKLKEKYWQEAQKEYLKRLSAYAGCQVTEVKESRLKANAGPAEEKEVIREEGEAILSRINRGQFVITLEIKGKKYSSEKLAARLDDLMKSGSSDIVFVIGGSLGLSEEVLARSDMSLSFSDMTFPHQMMRIILLEQIYRSFKILRNEPYHK